MEKFHTLDSHKLRIVDLAGLTGETITSANAVSGFLGQLGSSALVVLVNADSAFRVNLIADRGSELTRLIYEADTTRDGCLDEINRTSSAAALSSIPVNAAAGRTLVNFLRPYHRLQHEPIMSETSTVKFLQGQYNARPELHSAAATLQLDAVFSNLFMTNDQVDALWNERALEDAAKSKPSASTLRPPLEKAYNAFCDVIVQTLSLQPSPQLENLFSVMNEIRVKYSRSLPVRLTDANTSVAPIDPQPYTGRPVTPLPQVLFTNAAGKTVELLFSVDYTVTYRQNTDTGEAKIIIHGKGKYTGKYTSTFHIVRE